MKPSTHQPLGLEPRITPIDTDPLLHRKLTEAIIGGAMRVLSTLKPGLDKKAYENALVVELGRRGHRLEQQKRFEVRYESVLVDMLVPDLIVDEAVVVDTKVVEDFTQTHTAKMLGYLAITDLRVALLLNFKFADLRWKRVVR
jgi:GxxExxY protein